MKETILVLFLLFSTLNAKVYFYQNKKMIVLKQDRTKHGTSKIKYYLNSKKESIVVKNQFIIKLRAVAAITSIIQEFDLEIVKKINNNKFILEVKNIDNIFWKSNEINRRTAVLYAYPVYINKSAQLKDIAREKDLKKSSSKKAGNVSDFSESFKR